MRETVNTIPGTKLRWVRNALCALTIALLSAALMASAPALAEPPRPAGENRWVPSLGIYSGVTIQQWKGGFASACEEGGIGFVTAALASCNFEVNPGNPGPLRPVDEKSKDLAVSPFVGFNFQLMAPAFTAIPGRPRLYIFGESQLTFATDRDVASEGDPSGVAIPDSINGPTGLPAFTLNGLGSKTTGTYQIPGWGAGAGIAFPFKIGRRQLWLKPNVAWTRYKIAIDGKVVAGIKNDPSFPGPPVPPNPLPGAPFFGDQIRAVNLLASEEEYYNGIGGGLEIEMDAVHFGPIGMSIFLNGNAYKVLGNRETTLSASASFDAQPTDTELYPFAEGIPADTYHAEWRFKVDPWIYRVGGGVRFSWLGD